MARTQQRTVSGCRARLAGIRGGSCVGVLLLACAGAVAPEPDGGPLHEAGWLGRAQAGLAAREYWASESRAGLQAPNRAQGLRTYFAPMGIRVHDRTAPGSPALVSLRWTGLGRGAALAPLGPGAVTSHEARVEIARDGLLEWYANGPSGLEQGFRLTARPAGEGPLVLELSVGRAAASPRGGAVLLRTEAGRTLRYAKLQVEDAGGRTLDARLEVPGPERLRIVVADAGAAYPLRIDPLLTTTADAQLEVGYSTAHFGRSVAPAGDVNGDGFADVIVGEPSFTGLAGSDAGAFYVFYGGPGGFTLGFEIASDQANANLGASVASAGDVNGDGYADVIVGAPLYSAGEGGEGTAFVFLGSPSGLVGQDLADAAARIESDQPLAQLGTSVAGAGDVNGDGYADVIVGAPFYSAGETAEGAAFVFLGSAGGLVANGNPGNAAAQLEGDQTNGGSFDLAPAFGQSVASAGDVNGDGYADVIVGAPYYNAGEEDEGAGFVFLGSASGVASAGAGSAHARLESDQVDAELGFSVASAGDVNGDGYSDVIVGAPFYDHGESDEGAAFVFPGSASGVASAGPAGAQALLESDFAGAQLGHAVGPAGDVNGDGYADVIVGAHAYANGEANEGAALVFAGSVGGVPSAGPSGAFAVLESDQTNAQAGFSAAGAGDVNDDGYADVVVGAPGYNATGVAFVYHGGAAGIADGSPATAHAQLEADQADAQLGVSVASAGDVNGDGFSDVIVGAPNYDTGFVGAHGAAFVFHGGAIGIANADPATAATRLTGGPMAGAFGSAVASAGDVDGDGYADVIVGDPFYLVDGVFVGGAFIFHGSATGIADGNPASAATRLLGDQQDGKFGSAVASAGDVNGDGFADVIVGAAEYAGGPPVPLTSAAFVFHGSASGVADGGPGTANTQLEAEESFVLFGRSVASAGDVNGDGYADVIVGAPTYTVSVGQEGAAFVFHGSAAGVASGNLASADAEIDGDEAQASLGWSVASAGDVNGDGYADVIVGAPGYDLGQTDEGMALVAYGSASGIAGSPYGMLQADQTDAQLGGSVASAGDVNGDGYADVIVAAPGYDAGQSDEGAAFVFLGSASGIPNGTPATARAQLESDQAGAGGSLGGSVFTGSGLASAGDVDGDGFADLIVGAPLYDAGQTDEGAAFVFLGNAGGRSLPTRQERGDGSGIAVQPWGASRLGDGFRLEILASYPGGTGRVRGEFEACPPGLPFGDAGCTTAQSPAWVAVDGTAPEALLAHTFTGLATDTLYRWRSRVLYAPSAVTEPGITAPPHPAHGPWRRHQAQTVEADVRALPEPGEVVLLLSGLLLLGVLARRRRERSDHERRRTPTVPLGGNNP